MTSMIKWGHMGQGHTVKLVRCQYLRKQIWQITSTHVRDCEEETTIMGPYSTSNHTQLLDIETDMHGHPHH